MDVTTGGVLSPFALTVEPMAAMLNFEIADDPAYAGLEIQRFDDPIHGSGLAMLLVRSGDRRVDVYREPGLRLEPASYALHAGLGEWREAAFEPARLEVTSTGVVVDVGLRDAAGRLIQVRADDRGRRPRRFGALLAPVGAAIERPTAMLLVWMPRFDLMRAAGSPPEIRIAGRPAATGRLPGAWLHRRRLIKMAADVVAVRLLPEQDGPMAVAVPGAAPDIAWEGTGSSAGIVGIAASAGGHEARLTIDPPLPDLARLPDGGPVTGTWRLTVDGEPALVSGTWSAQRTEDRVELLLRSTAEWRPGPLPLLMRIVTRIVPTFRTWPTSYRWRATVALGPKPTMRSAWERTGTARDEAYERTMRLPGR